MLQYLHDYTSSCLYQSIKDVSLIDWYRHDDEFIFLVIKCMFGIR